MKLSKLQQKTTLAAASAEEARARSAAASKTLEQIRERLHQAKLDLKKAKKRAKQAKREARRAVGDAASLAKSLAKAEKKTRKRRKSGEAREAAVGGGGAGSFESGIGSIQPEPDQPRYILCIAAIQASSERGCGANPPPVTSRERACRKCCR